MSTRKKFEDEIAKLEEEIAEHQKEIDQKSFSIETWKRAIKMLPKEGNGDQAVRQPRRALRPGSDVDLARAALMTAKRPLHINDLLVAMGRGTAKDERISLASSIQAYVRKGAVFKKTAPNTFGLIEIPENAEESVT